MLNSLEIEAALKCRGFWLEVDNAHAKGYLGPLMDYPVYVKTRESRDQAVSGDDAPLVVHPDAEPFVRHAASLHPGIRVNADLVANSNFRGYPKRLKGGQNPIAHGLAVAVDSDTALELVLRHILAAGNPDLEGLAHASVVSVDAFKRAYLAIEPRLSDSQKAMLLGHARAPDMTLTMTEVGRLAGYDSLGPANIFYGKLGDMLASELGVQGLRQKNLMQAIGRGSNDDGEWHCTLRWPLARALFELGLLPAELSVEEQAALTEPEGEPGFDTLPETTRQALAQARVGQGRYREALMQLWGGACAVTGVDIPQVLIASHAKAWKHANHHERLDPANGLLLVASIDRLFDQGLISFDDDGRLLMKEGLPAHALPALGLSPDARLRSVPAGLPRYLQDHRRNHGFDHA